MQSTTPQEVVRVNGLYKKYSGSSVYAVENVTFSCYEGEIVGLLGHNGAGKSTTLKCIEGMLPFSGGEIYINGHDIKKDPVKAKQSMGFVTDNHAVFIKMTGIQYLSFMADAYKVPTKCRAERLKKLEEVFCLGDAVNNLISSYSHGMRQKICILGALTHEPKLWILDEPMVGLDHQTMTLLCEFIRGYANEERCVLFSSHNLEVVRKTCDKVIFIKKGELANIVDLTENKDFDLNGYYTELNGGGSDA